MMATRDCDFLSGPAEPSVLSASESPVKIDPDAEVQLEKPLLQSAMYIKGRGRKSDSRRFYAEDCGTPAPPTPKCAS